MAHGRDSTTPLQRFRAVAHDALPAFVKRQQTVVLAVGAVTLFALALRLFALGFRPAHWDEGRVAYWALRYHETGAFGYQYIIHGPFIHHATQPLFAIFGSTDLTTRIPVALVGGLVPLSALLYRKHLRDAETVVLALLLASNPIVLYYSRFMRSDVLVAAFMFTAFGFVVRYYDTRKWRYLYGAAVFLVCGVASKENAVLYVLTWLGAAGLLADTALFRPRSDRNGLALLRGKLRGVWDGVTDEGGYVDPGVVLVRAIDIVFNLLGIAIVVLLLWLFMFASRGNAVDQIPQVTFDMVSFSAGMTDPAQFPALVSDTFTHWQDQYFNWFGTSGAGEEGWVGKYEKYAPDYLYLLFEFAAPVMVFSILAFVGERYGSSKPRNLVMFFCYAGFVSALAYPLAMDIFGPWNATHAVVPLMIPAAVGIGTVYRWAREDRQTGGVVVTGLAAVILLVVAAQVGVAAYDGVYQNGQSGDNSLTQYGQPADDMRPTVNEVYDVSAANSGTDILVFGGDFVDGNVNENYQPACMGVSGWFESLPIPWYLYASDAEVACAENESSIDSAVEAGDPPIVVAKSEHLSTLRERFPDHEVYVHRIRTSGSDTAFLIDRDALSE